MVFIYVSWASLKSSIQGAGEVDDDAKSSSSNSSSSSSGAKAAMAEPAHVEVKCKGVGGKEPDEVGDDEAKD